MAAEIPGDRFRASSTYRRQSESCRLTYTNCNAKGVEKNTPWQNGPSFLKLPGDQWPVSRDFKMKIPEDEIIKTIHELVIHVCHLKASNKLSCSCKACSLLSVPCECAACKSAIRPVDSPHFQSLCHIFMQTNKIEKARGIMARVLWTSAPITKAKRPGVYKDFSKDKMNAIMRAPLTAEDYQKADRIMLLLM